MSQSTRWSIAALFFLAIFVQIATQQESWEGTPTSHGIIPEGHGAAYEMLTQLGLAAGRSYESERSLAEAATIWWIEPRGLCSGVEDGALEGGDSVLWRATDWMSRGGTAVVFLPDWPLTCLSEAVLAGAAVPARALDVEPQGFGEESVQIEDIDRAQVADARIGDDGVDADGPPGSLGGRDDRAGLGLTTLTGSALREPRTLAAMPLRYFRDPKDYEVLVASEQFGAFVIARPIGAGRLILVASSRPLRNGSLREADAAPFVVDLALAFGNPLIDEREHGLLPRPSTLAFVVRSDALPAIVGVLILTGLWAWRARAQLPARLEPDEPTPPTLDAYIASVARLYRSTRDHLAVLRAYQEFAVSQLRRSLRSPSDATPRQIADRLRATGRLAPEQLAKLFDPPACSKRSELLSATAEIDRIVEGALR